MTERISKLLFVIAGAFYLTGCRHSPFEPETTGINGYPAPIGSIVKTQCAITGCHDPASKDAAAGLDLSTWQNTMQGGRNNAAIIPFSINQSTFFLAVNHFEELGPTLSPTMPYGSTPLPKSTVLQIREWIVNGAPNDQGMVAFSDIRINRKLYILNSLCREVAVTDLETGLIIRYISLDKDPTMGFVQCVFLHPTAPYWYVLFSNGVVQQFDAGTDRLVKSAPLPFGTWKTLRYSAENGLLHAVNWAGNTDLQGGQVALLDPLSMNLDTVLSLPGDSLYFPIDWEATGQGTYYTACYLGNFVYKINLGNDEVQVSTVPISAEPIAFNVSTYRPTAIVYSQDHGSYFVACERSGEVRRFNASTDELEAVIKVGFFPRQMVIDRAQHLLFVSCTEDVETFDDGKSSVYIIDLQTNAVVKTVYAGYQSQAMVMDKNRGWIYVANRNIDPVGADEPHHYTNCEGKNGYLSRIDLNGLTVDENYRAELSVDPCSMSTR